MTVGIHFKFRVALIKNRYPRSNEIKLLSSEAKMLELVFGSSSTPYYRIAKQKSFCIVFSSFCFSYIFGDIRKVVSSFLPLVGSRRLQSTTVVN